MAGISSALGWLAIGKQSAKGTAAVAPTVKFGLAASPSVGPTKGRGRYNVTDIGRDPGPGYTTGMSVGGSFSVYMEPLGMGLLWYLVLGSNADAGAGPFTHTASPANDLPYCTIWRSVGGVVKEKYVDCKIDSVTVEGTAGSPFMVTVAMLGISSTYADTGADALAALAPAGYLFPELNAAVLFDATARRVHRLRFAVNNNLSGYQADDYFLSDIDPGKRNLELAVDFRFSGDTAFPDYRTLMYGSTSGTVLSPTVATHAFDVTITRAAGLKQQITLPQVTYTPWTPQPDPAGDPIEVSLACDVEKPSGSNIATIVSTDSAATV